MGKIFRTKKKISKHRVPKYLAYICAQAIFFTGCMVGPDYERPYLDIPDSFHYEDDDAIEYLNQPWWRNFGDDVLNDLIDEALANNKNVKIAAANIENAIGLLIQIRSPLFPQIGYQGTVSRTRTSETLASFQLPFPLPINFPNPTTTWQAVFTGSWEIDIWGKTRRLIEAAQANVYASVEARQGIISSLVSSVANTYFQLRSLDGQLYISIKTLKSYAESVTYFETQFKYGQTSQMTVVQAQTQYEIAAAKIPALKSQIAQTENALSVLLGSNPKEITRGKRIDDFELPPVPADLPSELLCQRPDIMQAEQELIAANAQIGAAKALYFPSLSLTGYYGNATSELHKLFTGPSRIWNYTGSITGPIFTAGAVYGQVFQAEAQQKAALHAYEQTIINAFAEVESALVNHTMLIDQLDAQKKLVIASGEYVRLATLQYKGGYAPYFIVIQAQEQFFPAELAWVQTQQQLLSAMVSIYQSMGGGWVDLAEKGTEGCDDVTKPSVFSWIN